MRRPALATAAMCAVAMVAAGCSDSGDDTEQIPQPEAVDPTASLEGVELTLWAGEANASVPEEVIAAFEDETGASVSVEVVPDTYETNVTTGLAAGDKPDLLFWQPSNSALPLLQPQKNLLTLDDEPWVGELGPAAQAMGTLDDHRYSAIVQLPAVLGVYYNKAAFANAGITTMPGNYDELLEVARQIKTETPDVAPFFEVGGDKWPLQWQLQLQMTALGSSFYDRMNANEAKWTDPQIVEMIRTYNEEVIDAGLAQKGYQDAAFSDQGPALLSGEAAMAVNLPALLAQMLAVAEPDELDDTIGWFPVSLDGTAASFTPTAATGLVAFKTGDPTREAAARQLLAFWLGPYYPTFIEDKNVPSVQPGIEDPGGLTQIANGQAAALNSDDVVGLLQVYALAVPDIHLYLSDMLFDQKTPEDVATASQEQFEQLARAQGAPGF